MTARRSLPVAAWPAPDRAMWERLTAGGGPLDEPGLLGGLRATSLTSLRASYARWLAHLAAQDPPALAEAPADRLTPERLSAWMEREAALAPVSRRSYAEHVLRILAAAAPGRDWPLQRRIIARERHAAARAGAPRKAGRILSSAELFRAGLALAARGGTGTPWDLAAARDRRDGLMVAMLALLPLRRRSFNGLTLGTSLRREGDMLVVVLGATDLKAGAHWEARLPDGLQGPLLAYIEEVRPWFLARSGARHDRLWTGDLGGPLRDAEITRRVRAATAEMLGVAVPPNFFRDAAATTLARLSPEAARLTRAILGHTTYRTAEAHYRHARMIETGRAYADLVGHLEERS